VGADRIARTAYAALAILATLCVELGIPIPLAWTPADVANIAAIEVYPAATLVAHRIRSIGYKKPAQTEERREIVAALRTKLTIGESVPDLATSADLVDAAVCVLAGADFLSGRAMNPEDRTLAEREGWIWTAAPNA
jgi:predicted RNase H-like nuclease